MGDAVPAAERAAVEQTGANPQALARMATRAEMRQPGSLAGLMAGSFLSSIAGAVIGSMIAREFFSAAGQDGGETAEGGLEDSGQAMGDGGGFDMGGFDA